MKTKYLFIVSCATFFLISCASSGTGSSYKKLIYKEISKSDKEYMFSGIENCSNLYTDGDLSVLEVYCSRDADGLYLYEKNYQTQFDWYDTEFNLWATSEGCQNKDDCYYELIIDQNGIVKEFKYNFFINLSEGFYKVKVIDKTLKIIDKKITDHPS